MKAAAAATTKLTALPASFSVRLPSHEFGALHGAGARRRLQPRLGAGRTGRRGRRCRCGRESWSYLRGRLAGQEPTFDQDPQPADTRHEIEQRPPAGLAAIVEAAHHAGEADPHQRQAGDRPQQRDRLHAAAAARHQLREHHVLEHRRQHGADDVHPPPLRPRGAAGDPQMRQDGLEVDRLHRRSLAARSCRGVNSEHFPPKWPPVRRRKCDQRNNSRAFSADVAAGSAPKMRPTAGRQSVNRS